MSEAISFLQKEKSDRTRLRVYFGAYALFFVLVGYCLLRLFPTVSIITNEFCIKRDIVLALLVVILIIWKHESYIVLLALMFKAMALGFTISALIDAHSHVLFLIAVGIQNGAHLFLLLQLLTACFSRIFTGRPWWFLRYLFFWAGLWYITDLLFGYFISLF